MDLIGFHLVSRAVAFILLTATIVQKASGQNYVLTSTCDGSVQTGDSCTLSCNTRDTSHSTIQWLNGSMSRAVSKPACSPSPSFPSDYSITCPSGSSTVFTVTFTNAQFLRDTVSWRCDYAFGGRGSNTVNITVEVPLTSVYLSRSSTSITCVATSSPRPSITLYRDGRSETTSPPAVEGSAGWTATLVYSLSGDRDNSLYRCEGSNSKTTINSTVSYPNISVSSVTLTNISSPNHEVGAAEGQPLTLTCVTSASYPAASVTWYKNNVLVTTGVSEKTKVTSGVAMNTTGSLTRSALSKSDLGQRVYCTATNTHTTSPVQSNTARLVVWYPPGLPILSDPGPLCEGQSRTLSCSSSDPGNPVATFYWTRNNMEVYTGSRYTFTLRKDDNGTPISCAAGNAHTDRPGHFRPQSETRQLRVYYKPTVDISPDVNVTFILGQQMSLLCSADNYPSTINFTWGFKGQTSKGPVLTRVNVSRFNEGVYTCTAQPVSNAICSGSLMIAHREANVVVLQSIPPPTDLLVWSTGPHSVKLSWKVGLHLTLSLQFLVQYKEETEAWVSSPGLYNGTGQEYVQGSVNDLKPKTLYFVKVQTVTSVGMSVFSGVARVLTEDRSVISTDQASMTTANAVLGTGIALIVVAVLGALFIFLFIRLRGRKKKTNEDKQYSSFQHQDGDTYDQLKSPTYQNTEFVETNVSPGENH